jgi:hypothetical protein
VSGSPATARLSPGGTRQFTATVSDTANQDVMWIATGGTISMTGLYTAGANGGFYTVCAISAQDPLRRAMANVTISAAAGAPVSVSGMSGIAKTEADNVAR